MSSSLQTLKRLYLFLSEVETSVEKDVSLLIDNQILTESEINADDTALVCISRDYFTIQKETGAFFLREQLSNVFCPQWRINSVNYKFLSSIMYLPEDEIPEIYVITKNKEMYDNLDYFLHLSTFEKKYRLLIEDSKTDYSNSFVEIESEISREDVAMLGRMTLEILEFAGYNRDENGPVPGWVFQPANRWLTRVLDLYQISPAINIHSPKIFSMMVTKDELFQSLKSPTLEVSFHISEDARTCFLESFESRKLVVYKLTKDLLSQLQ